MLDGFVTEDGKCWITMSSVARGLNCSQQRSIDWLRRNGIKPEENLAVKVGKRNKSATAYPVEIIVDFITYLYERGDKFASSLVKATLQSDLERTIKDSNNIQVTAQQHETNRREIRLARLERAKELVEMRVDGLSPDRYSQGNQISTELELDYEENYILQGFIYQKEKQDKLSIELSKKYPDLDRVLDLRERLKHYQHITQESYRTLN